MAAATLRLNSTVTYKGERAGSSLSATVSPQLEGYYLVNANIAYNINDVTVALWGTNLTDEQYYESYLDRSLLEALRLHRPARAQSRHHR